MTFTLDAEDALELTRLAERARTDEETLARELLTNALERFDADPQRVTEILDGIPGAFERAQVGREQMRAGRGIPLEELESPARGPTD